KPEVESTNNGTTDKPVTETDNATPAESTTNNNSTTTATNENAQSIDDVNTAKDNAIQAIDPIQASTDVKTNARAELLTEMQN
ncbi:hypothetical protein, partial [Staphylococcus sp. EG-SA-23]|uniref:hypothetical protein n=1 Tax=Staphylococcus sp. EG-SA-23 TaxID=2767497 RepID=UPI00197E19F0